MFDVRVASAKDALALADIHAEAWRFGYVEILTTEQIETAIPQRCTAQRWQQFASDSTVLIASSNEIAGGLLQMIKRDDDVGEVVRMYVRPEFWGSGISSALMQSAIARFESMNVRNLIVFSADTIRARRFYEKCGFVSTGVSRDLVLDEGLTVTDFEYRKTLSA